MPELIKNNHSVKCVMCDKKSSHHLNYYSMDVNWEGNYCDEHFLEKLKDLRWAWNKKLGKRK
jgi:hypothetical protein